MCKGVRRIMCETEECVEDDVRMDECTWKRCRS